MARRRPRWSPGRSGPSGRRRPAPKGPRRPRSRTRRREGDGRGEPAAVEGGDGDPGAGGRGWRLGRSRGARGSATSAHAAAASSTATTSVLCQREAATAGGWRGWHGPAPLPGLQSGASFLPTPDAPGRFHEHNEASRIRRRATGQAKGSSPTRWRRQLTVASSGHRWYGSSSNPRGQFVGALAFTRGCERNFWSFAQTTQV